MKPIKKAEAMSMEELAQYIDYSVLKPEFTEAEIIELTKDGVKRKCATICINPGYIEMCEPLVKNTNTMLCPVCDFPFGTSATESKVKQIEIAAKYDSVKEVDVVANFGWIRGGVTLNHGAAFLHSQSLRKTLHPNEKHRIAKYCAELIPEGSSIFIDCGSTTNQIAEAILQKKNITVMTNSLDVAQSLSTAKSLKVIMVPGVFSPLTRGFMGQFTSAFVKNFTIDFLFLGANGIDVSHGLTSPDYTDAETKKAFLQHAKKVIVATDHSKLDLNFFVRIATLDEIHLLVTDKDADAKIIENYRLAGTKVILV